MEDYVNALQEKDKGLEEKILDLEARSRCSMIRLVNLPEGAEDGDTCGFRWKEHTGSDQEEKTKLILHRGPSS